AARPEHNYVNSENATIKARLSAEAMSKVVSSMLQFLSIRPSHSPTPVMQFGCHFRRQPRDRFSEAVLAKIWHSRSVIHALPGGARIQGHPPFQSMPLPSHSL